VVLATLKIVNNYRQRKVSGALNSVQLIFVMLSKFLFLITRLVYSNFKWHFLRSLFFCYLQLFIKAVILKLFFCSLFSLSFFILSLIFINLLIIY